MRSSDTPRAAILIIGNEVLSGKIHDSNSHWLARELFALGVSLQRVWVIPDDVDVIADSVAQLSRDYDHVFTSGGVGPTHDDVTYAGIAQGLGLSLHVEERLLQRLRDYYGDRLNKARERMALVPSPNELCFGEGMVTPVLRAGNVYVLPGIPLLFRQLFGGIRDRFRHGAMYLGQIFTGQGEGDIAAVLSSVDQDFAQVNIGSYPRLGDEQVRVKLTIESLDEQAARQAYQRIVDGLDARRIVRQQPVERVCADS